MLIGNLECCLQLFINPCKDWSDTDITELWGFRSKSILAGDLNASHSVWNCQVSNHSGLKLLELLPPTSKSQSHNTVTCLLHVATINVDSPDLTRKFIWTIAEITHNRYNTLFRVW
jgi:hypothetical protein